VHYREDETPPVAGGSEYAGQPSCKSGVAGASHMARLVRSTGGIVASAVFLRDEKFNRPKRGPVTASTLLA